MIVKWWRRVIFLHLVVAFFWILSFRVMTAIFELIAFLIAWAALKNDIIKVNLNCVQNYIIILIINGILFSVFYFLAVGNRSKEADDLQSWQVVIL